MSTMETVADPVGVTRAAFAPCDARFRRVHNGYIDGRDLGWASEFGYPACGRPDSPLVRFIRITHTHRYQPVYLCAEHAQHHR